MASKIITPAEAAKELLRRRAAGNSLLDFTRYRLPTYSTADHHRLICDKLQAVERGEIKRLMIFMPPRHGKSELASKSFPAWFLGRNPGKQIIACSYNSELAGDFGRAVRNIVGSAEYKAVFPGVELSKDNKAADRWQTNLGGVYVSSGVGSSMTGRGADILLIDDPIKGRADADSPVVRQRVWDWWTSTAYTRLMPGGAVIIIQCMTGDTPVLMASGGEKALGEIKVGDEVATYDNGSLCKSVILNHMASGVDKVFKIKTTCGISVRANERHPFLVKKPNGDTRWVKLKDLKKGDLLVLLKGAGESRGLKLSQENVMHAKQGKRISVETLKRYASRLGIGANILGNCARLTDVKKKPHVKVFAKATMVKKDGLRGATDLLQSSIEKGTLNTVMASVLRNLTEWSKRKMGCALFAISPHHQKILWQTGMGSSALTTATAAGRLEHYCVTAATSRSDIQKPQKLQTMLGPTCDFTLTAIDDIVYDKKEVVYDIQVERTGNFIANGLVVHNTRWHMDDLSGRLLNDMQKGGEKWDVLSLPALDKDNQALWPEWFPLKSLKKIKTAIGSRDWSALYQQDPAGDDKSGFDSCWLKTWRPAELKNLNKYIICDPAGEKKKTSDYSVFLVVCLGQDNNYYICDMVRDRLNLTERANVLFNLHKQYRPLAVGYEKYGLQSDIEHFEDRMNRENYRFNITKLGGMTAKNDRIKKLIPLFEAGRIYLPETCIKQDYEGNQVNITQSFINDEYNLFPVSPHDDMLDCLARIVDPELMAVFTEPNTNMMTTAISPVANFPTAWV